MTTHNASRRLFVRQLGALSTLGAAAPLALNLAAMGNAAAQSATDYKALVCVFLYGGNDCFNTVLPTDATSWANYAAIRGSLVLPGLGATGGVLPITPATAQTGRSFALNPQLGALQTLFNGSAGANKRLAIVANVGPLAESIADARVHGNELPKAKLPPSLFSHNDQQNVWQSLKPEGVAEGWGGRLGDLLAASNGTNAVFTSVSAAGNAVWLSGQNVRQYQVGSTGAVRMGDNSGRVFGSDSITAAMNRIVSSTRGGHVMEQDLAALTARSISAEAVLRSRFPASTAPQFGASPVLLSGSENPLASQLRTVAQMIEASRALGVRRQVFFVGLGDFDTHDGQTLRHTGAMNKLAHGLNYFDTTLASMDTSGTLRNSVTTFTASDFGRSLTSNGDGTDHGWGGHHFVMGGAVKGGDIYGKFPVIGAKKAGVLTSNNGSLFDSPDQLENGMLMPQIAIEQYGATLARWFGVTSSSDLLTVFPNLGRFATSNLGFMS